MSIRFNAYKAKEVDHDETIPNFVQMTSLGTLVHHGMSHKGILDVLIFVEEKCLTLQLLLNSGFFFCKVATKNTLQNLTNHL